MLKTISDVTRESDLKGDCERRKGQMASRAYRVKPVLLLDKYQQRPTAIMISAAAAEASPSGVIHCLIHETDFLPDLMIYQA